MLAFACQLRMVLLAVAPLTVLTSPGSALYQTEPTPGLPCTQSDPLQWLKCAVKLGIDECMGKVAPPSGSTQKMPCGGRTTTNGILGILLTAPESDNTTAIELAAEWIEMAGAPGTTFTGQAYPGIWYRYRNVFNQTTRQSLFDKINATASAWRTNRTNTSTQAAAGDVGTDVSYNNMYYMNMVNAILFGEIAGDKEATDMGYRLLGNWLDYAQSADLHEFSSPTYYWVQINSLYMGYMYARRDGAKEIFSAILDHTWADICANYFAPTQIISGPHSRDYDFLFGHGALQVLLFAQSLPGMRGPLCEINDTHCERTDDQQNVFALLNLVEGDRGYNIPEQIRSITEEDVRTISGRYIGQNVTANGIESRFAHRYNYVKKDCFTIGTASQDYITNTHSKYYPGAQDKLFDIEMGPMNMSMRTPVPAITIVPDYQDDPYGHIHEPMTDKPSHLALHPGMLQHRNVALVSTSINAMDTLDGFKLNNTAGTLPGDQWHALSTSVILPLAAEQIWLQCSHTSKCAGNSGRWIPVPHEPFATSISVGDTIALSVGSGAVAIRILEVDKIAASSTKSAELMLKGDVDGMSFGALRLVGYHSDVSDPYIPSVEDTAIRFAFVVKAVPVKNPDNRTAIVKDLAKELATSPTQSKVVVSNGAKVWSLSATLSTDSGPVDLAVDSSISCTKGGFRNQTIHTSWNCLLKRAINGTDVIAPKTLLINGKEAPRLPIRPPWI